MISQLQGEVRQKWNSRDLTARFTETQHRRKLIISGYSKGAKPRWNLDENEHDKVLWYRGEGSYNNWAFAYLPAEPVGAAVVRKGTSPEAGQNISCTSANAKSQTGKPLHQLRTPIFCTRDRALFHKIGGKRSFAANFAEVHSAGPSGHLLLRASEPNQLAVSDE
ncbi:hypothetical protein [Roseovarius indicus]|uniref:hypothetical protein n=1 Tax=Roseovarius indicus TaxID=540747 RepID=UPI000945B552|nr:hypothetical protein [Roseovarius indicus]